MSYCRWSSDNWKCDLYCYEDVNGGYTTHVAGRRRVGDVPDDRMLDMVDGLISAEEWSELHREQMKVLDSLPFEDINLPHAGDSFNDPTLEAFKARIMMLRGLGYHVPDYVLADVEAEIATEKANESHPDRPGDKDGSAD